MVLTLMDARLFWRWHGTPLLSLCARSALPWHALNVQTVGLQVRLPDFYAAMTRQSDCALKLGLKLPLVTNFSAAADAYALVCLCCQSVQSHLGLLGVNKNFQALTFQASRKVLL